MKLALFFIIATFLVSLGSAQPCGSFSEFTLFPNPVRVGQTAFLRAVVPLARGAITGGVLDVKISVNDVDFITFNDLPLCNISDAIQCKNLVVGNNAINVDLPIPRIYPGKYTAVISATLYPSQETFCHSVDLVVQDPDQTGNNNKGFFSYFLAAVAGVAQFANPSVADRQIGDLVQVGPVGAAPNITSFTFPWGTFLSFSGSEDAILPSTRTTGFVWGLTGSITDISYRAGKRLHTYSGTFTVGYASNLANRQMDFILLEGDFTLTWIFDQNLQSTLSGNVHFNDNYGAMPAGWNAPITIPRYGYMDVATSPNGIIMVTANKTYCPVGQVCKTDGSAAIITPSTGLSGRDIGIIVGTIVGACLLAGLIIALVLWRRHRKHYEEEAGIFSAVRKPQYGNALVVDDIIQETREHTGSPVLIPPLNHRGDSDDDYVSDDDRSDSESDESQLSDHRPTNNHNNNRSRFGGDQQGGSPGPNTRRNRSPSPARRSRSPPPRYSQDLPRRRDEDSGSYYSDAGSSASRASSSDDE